MNIFARVLIFGIGALLVILLVNTIRAGEMQNRKKVGSWHYYELVDPMTDKTNPVIAVIVDNSYSFGVSCAGNEEFEIKFLGFKEAWRSYRNKVFVKLRLDKGEVEKQIWNAYSGVAFINYPHEPGAMELLKQVALSSKLVVSIMGSAPIIFPLNRSSDTVDMFLEKCK